MTKKWALTSSFPINQKCREPLHGIGGEVCLQETVDIPIFYPYHPSPIAFYPLDFHPYFDGLIGTKILLNEQFDLDLKNRKLLINHVHTFPIKFYHPTARPRMVNHLESSIRTEHLLNDERNDLTKLLEKFPDVFHNPDQSLTCMTNVKCAIRTTDDHPVYQKTYPYPVSYREEVDAQIKKMLKDGIIRPSRSAWNSPIWVVPKKTDASGKKKFRLVIDYRKLNQKTISDTYPMPEIHHVLDQLGGNAYFTTLDLASGFHQIQMKESDIEKTAFSVDGGKYEFLRMPFGLKNSPATFQRAMDDVLRVHIAAKRCYVYIDDVVVLGDTLENHLRNLYEVLKTLRDANLKVQLDKTEFLRKEVEYLGYVISVNGIKPNEKKIQAIKNWPIPRDLRQLRGFLGLSGYYRRFIKNYADIAKPLTLLMRGDREPTNRPITLGEKERKSFNDLKNTLTGNEILTYPDYSKHFLVTTDASDVAIGAVLSQGEPGKDRPIHFISRTLTETEEGYSATEKELLAIVWALDQFRNYVYGQRIKILTDHQPLTFSISPKNPNPKLKRWKARIDEYDHELVYFPGKSNKVADALSRIPAQEANTLTSTQHSAEEDESNCIVTVEAPINAFKNQLIIEQVTTDESTGETVSYPFPSYQRTICKINTVSTSYLLDLMKRKLLPTKVNGLHCPLNILGAIQEIFQEHFSQSGLRVRHTLVRLIDIDDREEQIRILRETHERAHRGIDENRHQVLTTSYFPNINKGLRALINTCDVCNKTKYDRHPLVNKVQETPLPRYPYDIIHLDIFAIENQLFLSSIDKFSKYARMIPIESRGTVHVEPAFWNMMVSLITPSSVVIDNEGAFTSPSIRGRLTDLGVTVYLTPSHHSESNGAVERMHSTIIELYRILKNTSPELSVQDRIAIAVEKYNNTIHSSIGKTPKEILIPRSRLAEPLTLEQLEETRNKTYDEVLVKLQEVKEKQQKTHNKDRIEPPTLAPGKTIYVKDKVIKAKHKNRFKREQVQTNHRVSVELDNGRRIHKDNVKNVNLKT